MSAENTTPIYILLPICVETKTDLFFNVLKNAVSRNRLKSNFLENAFISGMTGEMFDVNLEDLSVDWTTLTSESQQVQQSKLLGLWATRHFPSFGRKLIGTSWQPPKRSNVTVIGSTEMTEAEINTITFKKMKLRILELNVSQSTFTKLKYFVRAPETIGKVNLTIISPKIKAFDIQNQYLENCWKALEVGEFPYQLEDSIGTLQASRSPAVEPNLRIEEHRIQHTDNEAGASDSCSFDELLNDKCKNARSSNATTPRLSPQYENMTPCDVTLTDIIQSTTKINMGPVAKRARLDVSQNGDSFDALRVAVVEMRKDIGNLTKWVNPNAAENVSEGPERLHLAVFKQKDAELSELGGSVRSLREDNEFLKSVETRLRSESEAKSELINALKTGMNAISKLNEKLQDESNVLTQKLSAADQTIIELTDTNRNLKEEIQTAKIQFGNMELSSQIQILNDTIRNLQEDLNVGKKQFASTESNLQSQIQNLAKQLSIADDKNNESTDTIRKLQDELSAAKNQYAGIESNLQSQAENSAKQIFEAHNKEIESIETIRKLHYELSATKSQSISSELSFQTQIQDFRFKIQNLDEKLSEANNIKMEMTNANEKLQAELNSAKIMLEENDKLEKTINDMKLQSDSLLCELQAQIQNSEKTTAEFDKNYAQLCAKNQQLQEEMNVLKQNAAMKDEEHSLLKSSLANQLESNIRTDLMKTSDGRDGHRDVVQQKENTSNSKQEISVPAGRVMLETVKGDIYQAAEGEIAQPAEQDIPETLPSAVMEIRKNLLKCQFGWIQFNDKKDMKCPGFVHPPDEDGNSRAQKVTLSGSVSTKRKFFSFNENIPDDEKDKSQIKALKKLNDKFHFQFK